MSDLSAISSDEEKKEYPGRFPKWLKRPVAFSGKQNSVEHHLKSAGLHTVCSEAKCPNRSECYNKGTATFLIMGNVCTRNCSFCSVNHGSPLPPDPSEGMRVAEAAAKMGLKHVVITSVTRDDLVDGGASCFAQVVQAINCKLPGAVVEILIPDFKGNKDSLTTVLQSSPGILNHNIETVPRLYASIRPEADYNRSLDLLKAASQINPDVRTKSGIMVGLGETEAEVRGVLEDLFETGCTIITIGQYLRPSKRQFPVREFVSPDQFAVYEQIGREIGFKQVFAGPYVRSSYRAEEICKGF
ncbi:lipoyl synthase [Chitinispirillales bacterium ANBcel5]|uniref:lipoyl synthase n=1 Tax=Cellulosispirillum alkaliphilum TaxID=3039283 RepID=UPI002A563268|nr:lipoyl synthase [Chitinispirillales bacterium ANBcel5]